MFYPTIPISLVDGSGRLRSGGKDLTEQEWDAFARLYREAWKAQPDLATLRIMLTAAELAAQQNRADISAKTIAGWQERLEKSRSKNFYAKHLNKGEQHISHAQGERSETVLMKLFGDDLPRIGSGQLK